MPIHGSVAVLARTARRMLSRTGRRARRCALTAILALLGAAPSALAAQRVEVLPIPSVRGNLDLTRAKLNRGGQLQAHVLLPDGYDEQPERRWPVLFLLHGGGDHNGSWLDPRKGDAARRAAGLPAIIVMPEGGAGYYTDAWLGGARQGVNWERYELDEVLPAIQARYRISAARSDHAIGGLSMGAFGTVQLAAQLPGYFGAAIIFSAILDLERPETERLLPPLGGFSYTRQWGPHRGPYVRAHNPLRLLDNLRDTRLFIASGDGRADATLPPNVEASFNGGLTEWYSRWDALRFSGAARANGLDVTYRGHAGVHAWPYWRRNLQEAVAWGPFTRGADAQRMPQTQFTYRTMAPHGNAWGLGFRFATPPSDVMTLTRDGQMLRATGAGTVTIVPGAADGDASGAGVLTQCAVTATLPFTHQLPAGC
jgi:S-formylglutathione hydrolase FrmB